MINRGVEIAGFLTHHKWGDALQTPFEADFSPRRYARLIRTDGCRAILMDADPDQKTPQFIAIAELLRQIDIRAPTIFASDARRGLVLMEDFGDQNMGAYLDRGGDPDLCLRRAVDVLVQIHRQFSPDMAGDIELPIFDFERFASQASLYLDTCFLAAVDRDVTGEEREQFLHAWYNVLSQMPAMPSSLLLRDYMPDNLMDLEGRAAFPQLGVLDFQDAGLGPIAYDLASLAEVVRRDTMRDKLDMILGYYYEQMQPACSPEALATAAAILSAQRHTRILGILVRLALNGRRDKLDYLPRVRQHLLTQLQHPALQAVADWFNRYSPLHDSSF